MNTAVLAKIRIIVCPGHYAVFRIIRRSHIPTAASDREDAFAAVSVDAPRIVLALCLTHACSWTSPQGHQSYSLGLMPNSR